MAPSSGPSTRSSGSEAISRTRHIAALGAGGGGNLGADPARADRHQLAAGLDPLGDRVGVGDGAQVEDSVEVGAGDAEAARLGAGREEQAVVADALAAGEDDLGGSRGRSTRPRWRCAGRCRWPRSSRRRGRRACPSSRGAGSPWRAAGARRGARAPRRSARRGRRSPHRAASRRPWRRRGWRLRSRRSGRSASVPPGSGLARREREELLSGARIVADEAREGPTWR